MMMLVIQNPCWGWLNTNATWRNITQERADELSAMYPLVIQNEKFNNFDMLLIPSE